jgi:hypothetical protein
MLERFVATDDANSAHWTVWACALAPDGLEDYESNHGVAKLVNAFGVRRKSQSILVSFQSLSNNGDEPLAERHR